MEGEHACSSVSGVAGACASSSDGPRTAGPEPERRRRLGPRCAARTRALALASGHQLRAPLQLKNLANSPGVVARRRQPRGSRAQVGGEDQSYHCTDLFLHVIQSDKVFRRGRHRFFTVPPGLTLTGSALQGTQVSLELSGKVGHWLQHERSLQLPRALPLCVHTTTFIVRFEPCRNLQIKFHCNQK